MFKNKKPPPIMIPNSRSSSSTSEADLTPLSTVSTEFHTGESINTYFIADFGFNPNNKNVRKLISRLQTIDRDSLLLLGGDLMYEYGKTEELHKQFKSCYDLNCLYQAVLGNHEYNHSPNEIIKNKFFNVNDWYYSFEYNNVMYYMLDTMLINTDDCYVTPNMILHSRKINTEKDSIKVVEILRKDMLDWLSNELDKNKNKINIVIGHYPIYTCSSYSENNNVMHKYLFPIFKKYNVRLYLSGHEHDTQHIVLKQDDYELNVVINGSCVDTRFPYKLNRCDELKFYNATNNIITKITFTNDLCVDFININTNKSLYNFFIN